MIINRREMLLMGSLAVTAAASHATKRRVTSTVIAGNPSLQITIPDEFGAWRVSRERLQQIVNPQQAETLDNIYDETLSLKFANDVTDSNVMLSLAYGSDQSKKNQVHKPEVCYPSQGFQIRNIEPANIYIAGVDVPVLRMTAVAGSRIEHVQYWIRQGARIVRGAIEQNMFRVLDALHGDNVDGLLVRTSIISSDRVAAFKDQEDFLVGMFSAMRPEFFEFYLGKK